MVSTTGLSWIAKRHQLAGYFLLQIVLQALLQIGNGSAVTKIVGRTHPAPALAFVTKADGRNLRHPELAHHEKTARTGLVPAGVAALPE